jgi:hypothetical protein
LPRAKLFEQRLLRGGARESGDLVAALDKLADHRGANRAGSAGDEDLHVSSSTA